MLLCGLQRKPPSIALFGAADVLVAAAVAGVIVVAIAIAAGAVVVVIAFAAGAVVAIPCCFC